MTGCLAPAMAAPDRQTEGLVHTSTGSPDRRSGSYQPRPTAWVHWCFLGCRPTACLTLYAFCLHASGFCGSHSPHLGGHHFKSSWPISLLGSQAFPQEQRDQTQLAPRLKAQEPIESREPENG